MKTTEDYLLELGQSVYARFIVDFIKVNGQGQLAEYMSRNQRDLVSSVAGGFYFPDTGNDTYWLNVLHAIVTYREDRALMRAAVLAYTPTLQQQLNEALEREDYETACILRDKIK